MSFVRWLFILVSLTTGSKAIAAPVILVLGDSLSSAYGIGAEQGWVSLLEDKLGKNGYSYTVVNASVSGDTTQDALSRLDAALQRHQPEVVIVELGGNDGLRAFPIEAIRRNLAHILETVRENGAKTVLAGMRIPPNYGPVYAQAFESLYPELAAQTNAELIPFFMEGIATDPDLMQGDGIHPNAEAQPLLLENVWPVLSPLLRP